MSHSSLGPSSAKRWMNCPGSVALAAKVPPSRPSVHAAEGTVAHAVCEEYHTGKIDLLALNLLLGTTRKCDGFDIEITEEMIEAATTYHDAIIADIRLLEADRRPSPVVSKTEAKVYATSVDKRVWGTADKIVYRKGNKLIIRDFKYGKGLAVEADENEQMALYAIGTMDSEAGWAFDEVELIIDQPRAAHVDGPERRWKTTTAWLKEFAKRAARAAVETMNPNAKVEAGPWCRSTFCPVQATCPALHGAAQAAAQVAFSEIVPAVVATTQEEKADAFMALRLPEVRMMSDAQLVNAYKWEDAVNGFFEAIKETLRERLSSGVPVVGVKLVEGRANRQYVSEAEVVAKFEPLIGDKLWEPRKLLSPAKLEKVVGKKGGVDALTFKPEGKKAIALDTDARPAARSSAQDAFTAIECAECDIMGGACSRHGAVLPPAKIGPDLAAAIKGYAAPLPIEEKDVEAELNALLGGAPAAPKKEPIWPT